MFGRNFDGRAIRVLGSGRIHTFVLPKPHSKSYRPPVIDVGSVILVPKVLPYERGITYIPAEVIDMQEYGKEFLVSIQAFLRAAE